MLTLALGLLALTLAFSWSILMPRKPTPKPLHGFAKLSPETLRAISSKGGKAVPASKRSFSRNPSLAQIAGRKGAANRPRKAN